MTFSKGRRSFSNPAFEPITFGPLGDVLLDALDTPLEGGYELTHGFHAYPGRLHPHTAKVLLDYADLPRGRTVLDPFSGSGAVLVEAYVRGLLAIGVDLNPVAHLVATERTSGRNAEDGARLLGAVRSIAAEVKKRAGMKDAPREPHPAGGKLVRRHPPHLFAELRHWYGLIAKEPDERLRRSLRAIFSSLVVKFSDQLSDSVDEPVEKHYPKGAVTRWMEDKARLLVERQEELLRRVPPGTPSPRVLIGDARELTGVADRSVDFCLTSPPYPGTYDYWRHHQLRALWLELDGRAFERGEIGARRGGDPAVKTFGAEFEKVLRRLAAVMKPDAPLLLVVGDWIDDGRMVSAADVIADLAEPLGFIPCSSASVARPGSPFGRFGPPKRERLLHFQRGAR